MRKLITLLAVATLAASPFAFAEEQAGNPNDVLQTVPGQNGSNENMTVADNAAAAAPVAPEEQAAKTAEADQDAAEAKHAKKHHHKHHVKKHHHKHHHHAAKKADANDANMGPANAPAEAPAPAAGTETPAH